MCSSSNTPKYFTEGIWVSLLPSILNLKLWSNFSFFGMNSTSSVFLILRLDLFAFSQFERLDKSLFICFGKICSEECDFHIHNLTQWPIQIAWTNDLFLGAKRICSTNAAFNEQLKNIKKLMSWNSYPK